MKIFFRNQPIINKNCLWRPCLLTDRDEMSNLYRGPSVDAFYHVSVHFGQAVSEEKMFFRNQLIRNKNCLWWPCLLTNRNEMSNHRGTSIDATKFRFILTKRFQRRRFLEIYQSETRIACGGQVS